MGRAKADNKLNIAAIEKGYTDKGLTGREFSEALGYHQQWWTRTKSERDGRVTYNIVKSISNFLGLKESDVVISEEEDKEETSALFEESDFEKEVREALNYTLNYLKEISEICLKLDKQQSENGKGLFNVSLPKVEKAESQVFVPEIDRATAFISKRGYSKMSRGYGRNKVLWIVKPSAVQSLQK